MRTNEWTNKQTTSTNLSCVCVAHEMLWNCFFLYFMYLSAEQLKFSIHEMSSQNGSFLFPSKRFEETSNFIPFDTILIRYSNHSFDFHEHSCIIIEKMNYANCLIWNESQLKILNVVFFSSLKCTRHETLTSRKTVWDAFFFGQQLKFHWMNEW